MKTQADLINNINNMKALAESVITKHIASLSTGNSPFGAMEWADSAFNAAGDIEACNHALNYYFEESMNDKEFADTKQHFIKEALKHASRHHQSSSTCSNLAAQAYSRAMAKIAGWIV